MPHPLTNFEIQKYYQNDSKFNGAYSRYNLPKINRGAYVTNLGKYESKETHLIALFVIAGNKTYFDSFEVQHIPRKLENLWEIKILQRIFIE